MSGADGAQRGRWRQPAVWFSLAVLAVVVSWALVPGWFTVLDPTRGEPTALLLPPDARHPFGTDHLGRDLFARVVHGAGPSLRAAVLAVGVALLLGSLIGLVSGFVGGRVDGLLMRSVDVLLAIPGVLLSLALIAVLGFGTLRVAFAVGLAGVAGFAKVMRAEVLRVRESEYVAAARVLGRGEPEILARHVLPNAAGPVLILAGLEFGNVVLAIAAIGFLGFGAVGGVPDWGSLIADGRDYLATAWWLTTLPGLVLALLVLATNRLSRAMERHGGTR